MPESNNIVFALFQKPVLKDGAHVICLSEFHRMQIREMVDGEGMATEMSMEETAEDLAASVDFVAAAVDWSIGCIGTDKPISVLLDGCPANFYSRLVATLPGNGPGRFEPRFTTPGQLVPVVSSEGYLFEG